MVLRSHQLGEADRIISLLTKRYGKVRAVARGVRRSGSRFGGRLELFGHVEVQLAQGRGALDVVSQVESRHPGPDGRDYRRFTAAEVLVEAADKMVSEDGVPAQAQYRLLLGALLALSKGELAPELIVDSYLLRGLGIAGYAVSVTSCSVCGSQQELGWFSPQGGGAVCLRCRPPSSMRIDEAEQEQLAALITGDWGRAVAADPRVQRRCHGAVVAYATWHLDRALRSLPFLEDAGG